MRAAIRDEMKRFKKQQADKERKSLRNQTAVSTPFYPMVGVGSYPTGPVMANNLYGVPTIAAAPNMMPSMMMAPNFPPPMVLPNISPSVAMANVTPTMPGMVPAPTWMPLMPGYQPGNVPPYRNSY